VNNSGTALSPAVELRTRILSGSVLIVAVVLAVLGGSLVFSILVAIGAVFGLREWHRLVNNGALAWETFPAALAIIAAVILTHNDPTHYSAFFALLLGAVAVAIVASLRRSSVAWHVIGVVYIGIPTLALVEMREIPNYGGVVVGGIFAAVWAADTGALFVGRFLGGPKLAPLLSPQKTWSGFVGGLVLAAAAEIIYVAYWGGAIGQGALFGILLGIAATCGDLFESWVKRVFRTKNSGNLIPGHGGMLDRVDSLLFAAPVAVAVHLFFGTQSLFGGHP
jgi:phosphatidate cytidylyltransferase